MRRHLGAKALLQRLGGGRRSSALMWEGRACCQRAARLTHIRSECVFGAGAHRAACHGAMPVADMLGSAWRVAIGGGKSEWQSLARGAIITRNRFRHLHSSPSLFSREHPGWCHEPTHGPCVDAINMQTQYIGAFVAPASSLVSLERSGPNCVIGNSAASRASTMDGDASLIYQPVALYHVRRQVALAYRRRGLSVITHTWTTHRNHI